MSNYISTKQASEISGLSIRNIQKLCKTGKITGATYDKAEKKWMIPNNWFSLKAILNTIQNKRKVSIIQINKQEVIINECLNAYVSPYSVFMIENFPNILDGANTICDFGAGTGVLGIVASVLSPNSNLVFIENNPTAFEQLQDNISAIECKSMSVLNDWHKTTVLFDTILCNPASLPNTVANSSFCQGGELGMDMILDSVDFACSALSNTGRMFIIVTSILPQSVFHNRVKEKNMSYRLIAKKEIPFRMHYLGIKEWVDLTRHSFPEMYYKQKGNNIYEELHLYEISKKGMMSK